jgi:hypothetical protein
MYALRALDFIHHTVPPYDALLLVLVDMVPTIGSSSSTAARICDRQLLAVPLAIFPPDLICSHQGLIEDTARKFPPGSPTVGIFIIPVTTFRDMEDTGWRYIAMPIPAGFLADAQDPSFGMDLHGHSLNAKCRITADMDLIHSYAAGCRPRIFSLI